MKAAFEESRDAVARLVGVFEDVMRGRKALKFDEASTRASLIDPFWRALGWDVENPREVVHEKRVATRKGTKRADYCFNVRGRPAFVVEAKEAGKKLTDPDAVFQAVRYGYNLPVPVAILTDFEEFRPFKSALEPTYENPGRGLIKEFDLTYDRYLDRWDDVYKTFSREAVYDGSLEKLVGTAVRNKEALDKKFFERLTAWREELARVIALDNGDVGVHDLNEAVQRILDRIIFVRVIEDREIEPVELLQDAVNRWAREKEKPLYQYVVDVFRRLDPQYNGRLFRKHTLSEELLVRDKPLSEFIESLYYPLCPYQFNVIGVEMLGTIYERFLGSTIRLTPTHRAKVEEKPEVRKAGGVYYTPAYIVDYIVENTVGKLLDGCKTPKDAARLKILDPACGSGSFLLGAFRRLIEWHEDFYNRHPEKISRPPKAECWLDSEHPDGPRYRLTARAKGRILVNNIYGVDIDPSAVEVTVMSLYLKVLEDVDAGLLMKTALLPPLDGNVKSGNSLIGSDYWDFVRAEQGELFERTDEEERRVNPFDWDQEFPEVIKYKPGTRDLADGYGFDAVIGNPPYIRLQIMREWIPKEFDYLKKMYVSLETGNPDIYVGFLEKGITLVNANGYLGYICPRKFFETSYGKNVVGLLREGKLLDEIVDFGTEQVFDDATTYTCILILNKKGSSKFRYSKVESVVADDERKHKALEERFYLSVKGAGYIGVSILEEHPVYFIEEKEIELIEHIEHGKVPLSDLGFSIFVGLQTSANDFFVLRLLSEKRDIAMIRSGLTDMEFEIERGILRPWLSGKHMKRYDIDFDNEVVLFPYVKIDGDYELITLREFKQIYPKAYEYFYNNRDYLKQREKGKMDHAGWFGFTYPKNLDLFEEPKILSSDINLYNSFTFDEEGYFFKSGYGLIKPSTDSTSYLYYLGLINSKLLSFWYSRQTTKIRGGYLRYFTQYIEQLPIRKIDFSDPADVEKHDRMVRLVDEMLDLHKRLAAAKSDADRTRLERAVKTTDRKIDALVYELYGLSDEEIRIIKRS